MCTMLNTIVMTLDCLVSNPLRKQMFHQDCIDLRSLIILLYSFYLNAFVAHSKQWAGFFQAVRLFNMGISDLFFFCIFTAEAIGKFKNNYIF